MSIYRNIFFPIITCIIGLLLGAFLSTLYWLQRNTELIALQHQTSVQERIRDLRAARLLSKEEQIAELEESLDNDICWLGSDMDASMTPNITKSNIKRVLRMASDYRNEFPHSSHIPEMKYTVDIMLSRAKQ